MPDAGGTEAGEGEPYKDWRSAAQAIKSAAAQAVKSGAPGTVAHHILQAHFDRFLSRVFSDHDESEWLLKGGTAMLARVPRTRATKDLDLASTADDLDAAINALENLAGRDLGDHLTFSLAGTRPTGLGDNQPGVQTLRATFTASDADTSKKIGDIQVDIVVGPPPVGRIETVEPANRLTLPRLGSYPYRLFPIADQIGEKVCATMYNDYGGAGRSSSRVKDLVDLVVIVKTQHVDLRELQQAIAAKRLRSRMDRFDEFRIPENWATTYRQLASRTPAADGVVDASDAEELVARFIRPALAVEPVSEPKEWIPGRGWGTHGTGDSASKQDPDTDDGDTHVRAYTRRSGQPVSEHTRGRRGRAGT